MWISHRFGNPPRGLKRSFIVQFAFLALGFALVGPASADVRYRILYRGVARTYVLHDVSSGRPKPLLLLLHGWTSNGSEILAQTGFGSLADQEGFAIVAPEGLNGGWNAGFVDLSGKKQDDVGFIQAVIETVSRQTSIDARRIYVVGHSNGGMLAHSVGAALSNKFAAIACVSATTGIFGSKGLVEMKPPTGCTNVLIIHSKRDPMVGYDRSSQALLKGQAAAVSAAKWAAWMDCGSSVRTSLGDIGTVDTFAGKKCEVRFVTLFNGFHEWPGGTGHGHRETKSGFQATRYIWDWLRTKSHPTQ